MAAAKKTEPMSVEEYLAREEASLRKHEYVDGTVYAMAGARNVHNLIASNLLGALHARLRGGTCRVYNSDTKIRLRLGSQTRFYYPDLSVVCRSNPPTDTFQDEPAALFEVLSEGTRRTDEGEKKEAYLALPSLDVLVLVEQDFPAVVVFRRSPAGIVREILQGLETVLPLPEIACELPLAEIYDGVVFPEEMSHQPDA